MHTLWATHLSRCSPHESLRASAAVIAAPAILAQTLLRCHKASRFSWQLPGVPGRPSAPHQWTQTSGLPRRHVLLRTTEAGSRGLRGCLVAATSARRCEIGCNLSSTNYRGTLPLWHTLPGTSTSPSSPRKRDRRFSPALILESRRRGQKGWGDDETDMAAATAGEPAHST